MSSINLDPKGSNRLVSVLITVLGLLLFMFSIDLLTVSMIRLNSDFASSLFLATNNPFVGLFVGLLMTALIQSSSTVTAMIVAVVASGSLTLGQAVPLVMGANIGTTITSTLVAFSFIMKRNIFKKALAAGVLHDIFNILTVLILFPLEVYFGFLSNAASYITATFFNLGEDFNVDYQYNVLFTRPVTLWLANLLDQPVLLLLLAVILVFTSIKLLSKFVLKSFMSTNLNKINKHIFQKPFFSFLYGAFFTAAVQSSTVTTSIIVPAVANRKVSLVKAFPFIIGANIGTTITAAIAAIYKTDAAISLAVVHFLFNLIGALLFMPFPSVRNIPVKIATFLGNESTKTRFVGFAYILLTFFIIPFLLIYFNKNEDIREMGHADRYHKTEIQK
ncbi:Na/Pi symporter [Cecembia calidifontis]|uniref:Sodium-dependent phosphate cotransporter n=1 Tax=Cecembia calidifontis TaxID=1187080 RepID=A0A4Q7P730_9BACT|nr:Na/Pi symporter [Cecembia calidifontis]RZS95280.1 sodium-dependent phosphate cotransporter [Cecembia calidifontis]